MEGYPKIAQLMSQHGELAIFRKFGSMNMQNLLYLQAELTYLESDYQRLAMQDEACAERPYRSRDLWSLKQPDRDGTTKQWDKFLEIREKLKEYSETFVLFILDFSREAVKYDHYFKHQTLGIPANQ
jgi:hypothetical protein